MDVKSTPSIASKVAGLAGPATLLEAIGAEKRQSSGGRIDILLKNQEDDSMYEVGVMLGETDETHIIVGGEYRLMKKTFFVRL